MASARRNSADKWEGAAYFAIILLVFGAAVVGAILFIVSFATVSIAVGKQPNNLFLYVTNTVLNLLGIDRGSVSAENYVAALGNVNNALSIVFAFLIAVIPPLLALSVWLWKRRQAQESEKDSLLLEHPVSTPEEEAVIMERYYRNAESIVVYAGDFSWLKERVGVLAVVRKLGIARKIRLISTKDSSTVKRAIGNELFDELAGVFHFDSKKDIRCSIITFSGGVRTFLYRYRDVEKDIFYICAVRNLPKASYLLNVIDALCAVPEQERTAVLICGLPGTGKTVAANSLKSLGFSVVSAGNLIREFAKAEGEPTDRISLMRFWDRYKENHGVEEFSQQIFERSGRESRVVFEGIRPVETINFLRKKFDVFKVIYLQADVGVRQQRLQDLKGETKEVFEALEKSSMEQEVKQVERMADSKLITSRWTPENLEYHIRATVVPIIS